jgi:hypothetical protein
VVVVVVLLLLLVVEPLVVEVHGMVCSACVLSHHSCFAPLTTSGRLPKLTSSHSTTRTIPAPWTLLSFKQRSSARAALISAFTLPYAGGSASMWELAALIRCLTSPAASKPPPAGPPPTCVTTGRSESRVSW